MRDHIEYCLVRRDTEGKYVRVAQLDRASDYGSEGREFESSRVHAWGIALAIPFLCPSPLCPKASGGCAQGRMEVAAYSGRPWHTSRRNPPTRLCKFLPFFLLAILLYLHSSNERTRRSLYVQSG